MLLIKVSRKKKLCSHRHNEVDDPATQLSLRICIVQLAVVGGTLIYNLSGLACSYNLARNKQFRIKHCWATSGYGGILWEAQGGNWSYADSSELWENGQMEGWDAGKQTFWDGNCHLAKLYMFQAF